MLTDKLERLVDAFEGHGIPLRSNLAPGATAADLDALAERRGFDLPEDYRTLYRWHNGHLNNNSPDLLMFRDNHFVELGNESAQLTIDIYQEGQEEYGLGTDPIDLTACLPIAELDGSVLVVPGVGLGRSAQSTTPVVSVFEGIDVWFLSIESMIDTCIEWVEQTDWQRYGDTPNEEEIWNRHNPGR